MRGEARVAGCPVRRNFHELHPAPGEAVLPVPTLPAVANGVLQQREDARLCARIGLVHQRRPPGEVLAAALEDALHGGVHDRVSGVEERSRGLPLNAPKRLLECYALVRVRNASATGEAPRPLEDHIGHLPKPEASLLGFGRLAPEQPDGFEEERRNEVRLQATCVGSFHLLSAAAEHIWGWSAGLVRPTRQSPRDRTFRTHCGGSCRVRSW